MEICSRCRKEHEDNFKMCERCREKKREYMRTYRMENKIDEEKQYREEEYWENKLSPS